MFSALRRLFLRSNHYLALPADLDGGENIVAQKRGLSLMALGLIAVLGLSSVVLNVVLLAGPTLLSPQRPLDDYQYL